MKPVLGIAFAAMTMPTTAISATLTEAVRADMPKLMELYRDLHANPELSMQEVRTPAKLAAEMRKLGFKVTEKVGKTGVVAMMENGPGPVLMVRADMDALPVTEETGLPFASKVRTTTAEGVETGVMHACGHDTHVSAWLGTARRMAAMKQQWSGTLMMVLQPGEETSQGARAMLDDGLFTRFAKPAYVLGFHDAAVLPAGIVGITPGYSFANVDSVDITVRGIGGHGALPATAKDPIVLASRIVTTIQTLISRENDPRDPAVVTVGSFHGGTKHNIISEEAKIQLTVRNYKPEVRKALLDGIARIARGEAIAAGVPEDRMPIVHVREEQSTPSVFNTAKFSQRAQEILTAHFGAERVTNPPAVMVGEDFSRFYLADKSIESLMLWVGATPKDKWDAAGGDTHKIPSLHSPFFVPDADAVISTATEAMTAIALDVLEK